MPPVASKGSRHPPKMKELYMEFCTLTITIASTKLDINVVDTTCIDHKEV
jgi:hypothetical protein